MTARKSGRTVRKAFPIIGMSASAGGLEANREMLGRLAVLEARNHMHVFPPNKSAAVVNRVLKLSSRSPRQTHNLLIDARLDIRHGPQSGTIVTYTIGNTGKKGVHEKSKQAKRDKKTTRTHCR